MTSYWSATTTARFLRDMGARVVRIETPPIGDFCRYYGRSMGMPITAEENPIHDIFNGGKECVALDLKDPKKLQLMHNMLAKADVFITSTRTAGLKKLGLDWETLHAKYPKLVMGQVTGYGINGPLVNRPGIDAIAYFGANGVILDTRTDPDSPPIYPPAGMGDTTTGITLLSGVLAALLAARETGVGDYVMTSLYGTGNFVTAGFATNCNYGYEWPREAHTMSPLGPGYKCRDGRYIYVFVNDYTNVWPKFAKALRLPEEVVTDPRFTTKESTTIIANRSALVDIIREYALKRDAQDILDELVAYDVPSCILNQYKDRFTGEWLEQSVSNGYLIEHTYPSATRRTWHRCRSILTASACRISMRSTERWERTTRPSRRNSATANNSVSLYQNRAAQRPCFFAPPRSEWQRASPPARQMGTRLCIEFLRTQRFFSAWMRTLPVVFFGSSGKNSTSRCMRNDGMLARQNACTCSTVSDRPGLQTMLAFTCSPHFGSGMP